MWWSYGWTRRRQLPRLDSWSLFDSLLTTNLFPGGQRIYWMLGYLASQKGYENKLSLIGVSPRVCSVSRSFLPGRPEIPRAFFPALGCAELSRYSPQFQVDPQSAY